VITKGSKESEAVIHALENVSEGYDIGNLVDIELSRELIKSKITGPIFIKCLVNAHESTPLNELIDI
jgi:hypothetical protein